MLKQLTVAAVLTASGLVTAGEIPSVVVSGTRSVQSTVTVPASITVIAADEIARSGARDLGELLHGQGGVQLRDLYGNGSRLSLSMRGFGTNAAANVLVMVDGRRLNNTDLAGPDLSTIALKDVQQVEIIQGSAGTLYGDQAVGGVINIITRRAHGDRLAIEAGAGSDETRSLRGEMTQEWAGGNTLRLSAERRHSDNFRDHNEERTDNALLRFDHELGSGRLFAEWQHAAQELELPGYLTAAELAADRTQAVRRDESDSISNAGRLGLVQDLTPDWQLEAELTQRQEDIEGTFFSSGFTQERTHKGFLPRLVGVLPLPAGEALITAGADLNDIDYRLGSAFGITDSEQQLRSLYAQAVVPLSARLSTTVGARHARYDAEITDSGTAPAGLSLDDAVTVAELGFSYRADDDTRLFIRRDGNFRFPLVDENTVTSPSVEGLETQTGVSWELGGEWARAGHRAKLVAYRLDLDDEIDYDPNGTGPWGPFGANINLEATRRQGVILEGRWQATPHLAVGGSYTYTDPEITAGTYSGNVIPFVAEHVARTSVDLRLAAGWTLFTEAVYTGTRYQDSDYANSEAKLDPYTVLNASIRYSAKAWHAQLRVDNASGEEYVSYAAFNGGVSGFYPAPERRALLTVGYRL